MQRTATPISMYSYVRARQKRPRVDMARAMPRVDTVAAAGAHRSPAAAQGPDNVARRARKLAEGFRDNPALAWFDDTTAIEGRASAREGGHQDAHERDPRPPPCGAAAASARGVPMSSAHHGRTALTVPVGKASGVRHLFFAFCLRQACTKRAVTHAA